MKSKIVINFLNYCFRMEALQWEPKLIEFQHILTKNDYLSRAPLPGFIDAIVFKILHQNQKYPDKKSYPNFYHWYVIMRQFSIKSIENWISERVYSDEHSQKLAKLFKEIIRSNKQPINNKSKSLSVDSALSEQNKKMPQKSVHKIQNENPQKKLTSVQKDIKKQSYSLMIYLNTVQNLENLSQRIYDLGYKYFDMRFRMKIKELQFKKSQKIVHVRFLGDKEICYKVKNEISQWNEVDKFVFKKLTTKLRLSSQSSQRSSMAKTTNFRS